MKVIKASYEIMNKENIDGLELLKTIERVGRTCYKSEDKITDESAVKFVTNLIKRGHEAMIEHNIISVRFICDRGILAEFTRHRKFSFMAESSRYNNYSKNKFNNEVNSKSKQFLTVCFFLFVSKEIFSLNNIKCFNLWV